MKTIDRIFVRQEINHILVIDKDNWNFTGGKLYSEDTNHWLATNQVVECSTTTGEVRRRYKD